MDHTDKCEKSEEPDINTILLKIRAASYRVGFNLWDIFRDLEPRDKLVTPQHKFLSVLGGPLKDIIGLTEKELITLTCYFQAVDGRVSYDQFCRMIHGEEADPRQDESNSEYGTYSGNQLSPSEEKLVIILLTKLVTTIDKPLLLKPYFMEYEMRKKKSGLIYPGQFIRVIKFLGFPLSEPEGDLLIRKYARDSLTVKYPAFLNDIENIRNYLKDHRHLDITGKPYSVMKDSAPTMTYPPLPRAELNLTKGLGYRKMFEKGWKGLTSPKDVISAIERIREHLLSEKIRLEDYFLLFDQNNVGRVHVSTFVAAIDWLHYGRTKPSDLFVSPVDVKSLTFVYRDVTDPERVQWKEFVDDIYEGVDPLEIANWPNSLTSKPRARPVDRLPKIPLKPPSRADDFTVDAVLEDLAVKSKNPNVNIGEGFYNFDKVRSGRVTMNQFENAMKSMGIFFLSKQLIALQDRYGTDDDKIEYRRIVDDVAKFKVSSESSEAETHLNEKLKNRVLLDDKEQLRRETDVVEVLAKVKKEIICRRIWMNDILKKSDPYDTGLVTWDQFKMSFDKSQLKLTDMELNTLRYVYNLFQKDNDPNIIEYKLFTLNVDEPSIRPCLERPPLEEAMHQRETIQAPFENDFVNFDERILISQAMKTLCHHVNLGHKDLFKSLDKDGTGVVTQSQLMQLLWNMKVLHLVSSRALEAMMKGFGYEASHTRYINYQIWLNAMDIVFRKEKAALKL